MRYEWVLLDADGTLFDYAAAEAWALSATLRDIGLVADEIVTAAYQRINSELWRDYERGVTTSNRIRVERWVRLLDELDATHDADELAEDYIGHLSEAAQLLPGARDALSWLGARARLALITNGLADVQRSRLSLSGLEAAFDLVVISDEIGMSKPDPGYFTYAFERMGRPEPSRCLVVGDNLVADIGGGAAAGCDTCWVDLEGTTRPAGVTPTYTVRSVADLPDLLADT